MRLPCLAKVNIAIVNAYLRALSPKICTIFFVENALEKLNIISEQSFSNLTANLRNHEFD